MIRCFARRHPLSFHFCIFACCREVLEKKTDCYEGPYDKAFAKYQDDLKAIEKAKLQAQTNEEAIRQAKAIIEAKEESKSDDEAEKAEDADAESKVAQRGNTSHLPPVKRENTVILFGAPGGSGVNANTAMCREISDILMRYDRHSLQSFIPTAFEMFSGEDASFEMIVSSTAQVCALDFTGDIVERSVAVIFLTTELKGYREYKDAKERADLYKELLINVFGFDVVEICLNFTRAQMHAKLDEFEAISADFNSKATGQAKLLLSVINVGFKLSETYNKVTVDELMPDYQECSDGTKMTR